MATILIVETFAIHMICFFVFQNDICQLKSNMAFKISIIKSIVTARVIDYHHHVSIDGFDHIIIDILIAASQSDIKGGIFDVMTLDRQYWSMIITNKEAEGETLGGWWIVATVSNRARSRRWLLEQLKKDSHSNGRRIHMRFDVSDPPIPHLR